jgi:MFS transporter, PPP family, 3-phenylpropionic acid transporter
MIPKLAINGATARVTWVMCCLFGAYGVVLPYLSRWLEVERGLAGAEIGAVLSLAQLARIGVGPLIAFWADGVADRRTPIRVLATLAVAAFAGFFFIANDFPSLLAFGFLALTLSQSISPFVEGAVLRACDEGKISYGLARGLGSAMFIVANVAGGILIARFGLGAVLVWILAAYSTLSFSAWTGLKPDPAPGDTQARAPAARLETALALLKTRRFLILIFACGLIQAAHAFYYGFSVLVWRAQGVNSEAIGFLWGFAVAAEVAFLWSLPLIERRLSAEGLILLGGGGAVVRWVLMGFGPTGFLLWPIQALHALSFAAAHVGAMRLLYREAPQHAAGLAQTLYAALASGLLMGLSMLLSGVLYDAFGPGGYWPMALIALLGTGLALLLRAPRNLAPAGQARP